LYGQRGRKYVIADPAVGIRYLSRKALTEGWADGAMLLLEPNLSRFFAQPNERVGSFGRFVKRAWPYRAMLLEAFLCALIMGLLSLTSPFLIQILTDDVLIWGDTRLLAAVVISVISDEPR